MDIKIIATDLDGTLLTTDKKLSDKNLEALKRANDKGINIVPSTGRPLIGIKDLLEKMPFVRYCLLMNGALVWDIVEQKAVYRSSFTKQQALELWDFAQKYNTMIDVHVDGVGVISEYYLEHCRDYVISDAIAELVRITRTTTDDVRTAIKNADNGVEKINLTFKDVSKRDEALEELKQFGYAVATSSVINNIEINHVEATKGNGLLHLAKHLGLSKENIMAFGDNGNDITMIKTAGYGVAMGNAIEVIKKEAFFVTLDNDDDGVAHAINKYILQQ